jgi:hypothetical protein
VKSHSPLLAVLVLLTVAGPAAAQVDPEEVCRVPAFASSCVFDAGGPLLVAQLTPGDYPRWQIALMLEEALSAADNAGIYSVYLVPSTGHHLIDRLDAGAGPGLLNLRVSASRACWRLYGFTGADRTGALAYESDTVGYCRPPGTSVQTMRKRR